MIKTRKATSTPKITCSKKIHGIVKREARKEGYSLQGLTENLFKKWLEARGVFLDADLHENNPVIGE